MYIRRGRFFAQAFSKASARVKNTVFQRLQDVLRRRHIEQADASEKIELVQKEIRSADFSSKAFSGSVMTKSFAGGGLSVDRLLTSSLTLTLHSIAAIKSSNPPSI